MLDSISQIEDEYFATQEDHNEVLKRSYYIFENKANNINKELDSIKDFFRFLLSKVNLNESLASEIKNYNICEIEKSKSNLNIYNSQPTLNSNLKPQNQKLIFKNNLNGNVLFDKLKNTSKSQIDLNNEEKLFNKNLNNNKQIIKNPSNNSASFNKLLNTNINTDSSQKLPKILSKLNESALVKSNFEKFISTPNNRLNNVRNFYTKHNTNVDENDNRVTINAETVSMSLTNNSNFASNVNFSPLLSKNYNSVSNLANFNFNNNSSNNNNSVNKSLNQRKGDFSFKNNIIKDNQKSTMKINLEDSESKKKLDSKENEIPTIAASSAYSSSVNSNSNSKLINSSKFKIDTKALNSKHANNLNYANSTNNLINSKKKSSNKSLIEQMKLLGKTKDKSGNIENSNKNVYEKPGKRETSEINKGANTLISNINPHNKIDLKKVFNSTKKSDDSSQKQQQNKNNIKDISGFPYKTDKKSSNLMNYGKNNKNSEHPQTKNKTCNSKSGVPRNNNNKAHNESDVFNTSNFSSINNSIASNSDFNFKPTNKINKETIETLAEDLSSDKESKKETFKSHSKNKEFSAKDFNAYTPIQDVITHKIATSKNNNLGNKVSFKSNLPNPEPSPASNNPIMKHITPSVLLDNRKFSILEIQGAESLNNLRELIEKNNREVLKKSSGKDKSYKDISENDDSEFASKNNSFQTYEYEQEKNSILESLPNLKLKSLFLVLNNE